MRILTVIKVFRGTEHRYGIIGLVELFDSRNAVRRWAKNHRFALQWGAEQ